MGNRLRMLLSIPKTIYFNFRMFPIRQAIHLPVLISWNTKLDGLKRGVVKLPGNVKRFDIKIGFGGTTRVPARKSLVSFREGVVQFCGKALLGNGIILANKGFTMLGDNFFCNTNTTIWCQHEITIGRDALIGWNVTFFDDDGHTLLVDGQSNRIEGGIHIGSHCWICSESTVMKRSVLGNDCVLGYGSILNHALRENACLYAGRPAKKIKEHIEWQAKQSDLLASSKGENHEVKAVSNCSEK